MSEIPKIYAAIPRVAKAIGAISKGRTNQQQGFKFRGIDDVLNACHAPLTDNGVFVSTEVSDLIREERQTKSGGVLNYTTLKMKVTFYAEDGSSVSTTTYGEAMDSADKSTNKAMSAALKYAFFQTFTIPLEEADDADKTTHELAPRPQPQAEPPKERSPEESAFITWVKPLIDNKTVAPVFVRKCVDESNGDYAAARKAVEATLPKVKA